MLDRLKYKKETIDAISTTKEEPITKKQMEDAIKLIETAHKIGCDFNLCLKLIDLGDFNVDSGAFVGVKIINDKKDGDKVLIQYAHMLFNTDTYIELKNIVEVTVRCVYSSEGDSDV